MCVRSWTVLGTWEPSIDVFILIIDILRECLSDADKTHGGWKQVGRKMRKMVLGEEEEPCACIVWGRGEKFQAKLEHAGWI